MCQSSGTVISDSDVCLGRLSSTVSPERILDISRILRASTLSSIHLRMLFREVPTQYGEGLHPFLM